MELVTLSELRNLTEDKARELLETVRWPDGAVCPHCGGMSAHKLKPRIGGRSHVRPGVYFCGDCRKQFTVTIGTIFEGSRIRTTEWLMAIYLMCSTRKGISAHQLHRTIGLTYKTTWFIAQRIRLAMPQKPPSTGSGATLKGTVDFHDTGIPSPTAVLQDYISAHFGMTKRSENRSSNKSTNEKPVSLYPLSFRQAVVALLQVKPPPKNGKQQVARKPGR